MSSEKIKPRKKIAGIADALRKKGKKIVTCNGTFDIIHIGHVKFLEEAKKQGDVLIVGLNSDSSVKRNKGEGRPINDEKSRAEFLSAFECVDYVVIFDEADPMALLDEIKPDVHANGEEYGENCIEAETVRKNGGKIYLVKRIGDFSTSSMIKKMNEAYKVGRQE